MIQWIESNQVLIWFMAAGSVVAFVATLMIVPLLVVRIPSDYFAHGKRTGEIWAGRYAAERWIILIAKNMLGYILVAAGIIMLVLPGQGILTIVIGMALLNFPGKYRLEKWIVSRHKVLQSINWIRRRAGKKPLVL